MGKLTAENDHKFNMKKLSIGKNLWDIVNGTEKLGDNVITKEKHDTC